MLNWFKKLFKNNSQEQVIESSNTSNSDNHFSQILSIPTDSLTPALDVKELWECDLCNQPIYSNEKWSKQMGKHFHKKCYRELKKFGNG